MPLVWVTGNSGAGKSSVCALLRRLGYAAFDTDDDGYSGWVDRSTGDPIVDPPDPVPEGWLYSFGWQIDRAKALDSVVLDILAAARGL